jgi:two-component SAPR family response regulator
MRPAEESPAVWHAYTLAEFGVNSYISYIQKPVDFEKFRETIRAARHLPGPG